MSAQHRTGSVIGVMGLILATIACALPTAAPPAIKPTATAALSSPAGTATPTAKLLAGGSSGGSGGSSDGGSGGNSGGGSGGSDGSGGSSEAPPTQLPATYGGPYEVKQIETLGGEVISGIVCSVKQTFNVLSVTPTVTFTFVFVPQDAQHGNVSYAYSIPDAGETHDATGTYKLAPVDHGDTLQLSLAVSDHVVFHGFDGKIPNRYKFNLVPTSSTSCPPAP